MLPEPTFTLTIPSIYDDTTLDCRVYNPPASIYTRQDHGLSGNDIPGAAIVAHPYASFGGCYDDHVVLALVAEILRERYVVGTFNFRGAESSKGRTSWSGKPELHDYISFVGFLTHYIIALRLPDAAGTVPNSPDEPLCRIATGAVLENTGNPSKRHLKLILGGYSYGSLIASHVPPIDEILKRFEDVQEGTAESEIKLRASGLAAQWNQDAQLYREIHRGRNPTAHGDPSLTANSMSTIVGGEESEPGSRRLSRESHRSMSAVRRSFERTRHGLGKHSSNERRVSIESEGRLSSTPLQAPQVSHLLISPLLPPVSNLATMFTRLTASPYQGGLLNDSSTYDVTESLHSCETLAIYGSKDLFTSRKKLRAWSEALSARPNSRFHFHEVLNAGHFWREEGVVAEMRNTIREWLELLRELPKPDRS